MRSPLNWNSHRFTRGWQKGISAFYYGLGFSEEDFDKPQVGIGVPLLEGNLCNVHAYELGQRVAEGCRASGLLGFVFGTPGVSDNITQGHEGGSASLPSRNLIANSAECVVSSHGYDALVGLHHCDKNGPGFAMALARLNYPGLVLSGGSIMPGCHKGRDVTILDVYDAQAAASVGAMSGEEANAILRTACPGPGGCGIAASFNTWGIALEAMGLSPPDSSSIPAIEDAKRQECLGAGRLVRTLLEMDLRPRDILRRQAFVNGAAAIAAIGGSTNGILHLLALAQEAEVAFTLKDCQEILRSAPVLCSFAPRGKKTMADLHRQGGASSLIKHLIQAGVIKGGGVTVTGKSLWENVKDASAPKDRELIAPADAPFRAYADMQICFGNLAPDGIVFKVSSLEKPAFRGLAVCFEDARAVAEAVEQGRIAPGSIIVLRNLGPTAAGMPEVLIASAALAVPSLEGKVALISDTRVSGVSHGAIGVHCAPEAAVGGPIALVRDGDEIAFDALEGTVELRVSAEELQRRRGAWTPPRFGRRRGYLADFAATASQADKGCVSACQTH